MPKSIIPPLCFNQALEIPRTLFSKAGGKPYKRILLAKELNQKPESNIFRDLLTSSSSYGFTKGGYRADEIALTERGRKIVENNDQQELLNAVTLIELTSIFLNEYQDHPLPSEMAIKSFLKKQNVPERQVDSTYSRLLQDCRELKLVTNVSGSEYLTIPDLSERDRDPSTNESKPSQVSLNPDPKKYTTLEPNLQVNIQIHIDSSSSEELIESIFKNMKKYLFEE